jgi:hypothetical protein
MTQLDDYTRRALCAADQPPPGVEDRILAAILGPVGGPPPDGGMSSGAGSGAIGQSTLVYAVKVVGATLGLAAGGVALLAVTAAGVREFSDSAPRQASARVEVPAKQLEARTTAAVAPSAEPVNEFAAVEAPEAPKASESVPAKTPSKPAPAEPEPVSENTIEAELALMKIVRASKDHERALSMLDRHRREFAAGVFAAEREVLRVEHLCALHRTDEAEAIAETFIAQYPDNPLRSRVDPACNN